MARVSVFLSKSMEAAVEASGKKPAELIALGLEYLGQQSDRVSETERVPGRRAARRDDSCPHPPARRAKGLCMACGTYVG
jgi:hypothetical protein